MLWNPLLQRCSAKHQTGRLKQTGLCGKKEAEAEQKKATMNSTASEIQIRSCFTATGKRILSWFLCSKRIQALGSATCFVCFGMRLCPSKVTTPLWEIVSCFSNVYISQKATPDEISILQLPLGTKFLYGVHRHFNRVKKFSLTG